MQNWLNILPEIVLWVFFFATSVYGHVGFKSATQTAASGIWGIVFSFWGITAALAWGISALLWIALLSRSALFKANTVSALSDVFIVIAAVIFFKESLTARQIGGIILVITGVILVARP